VSLFLTRSSIRLLLQVTKLVSNYRSHPAIISLPSQLFYDDELKVGATRGHIGSFQSQAAHNRVILAKRSGAIFIFKNAFCLSSLSAPTQNDKQVDSSQLSTSC